MKSIVWGSKEYSSSSTKNIDISLPLDDLNLFNIPVIKQAGCCVVTIEHVTNGHPLETVSVLDFIGGQGVIVFNPCCQKLASCPSLSDASMSTEFFHSNDDEEIIEIRVFFKKLLVGKVILRIYDERLNACAENLSYVEVLQDLGQENCATILLTEGYVRNIKIGKHQCSKRFALVKQL